MPKLFAARWPIGIFVALLLVAGMFSLAPRPSWLSGRAAADTAVADDYAGERQQLLFFKAALGRIDDELRRRGAAATPSLRGEREAVLRRMREVAIRLPADRLPAEIAGLLQPAPVAAAPAGRPAEPATPRIETGALQIGLGTRQASIDFSGLALDPPPPLPVYLERPARRTEHARDAEPAGEKAAKERPAKDKERVAAERSSKEQPAADRPVKGHPAAERPAAERPAERPVAARPPVTVERTAVADQSERRQPAR